jgi:hypothetical protein
MDPFFLPMTLPRPGETSTVTTNGAIAPVPNERITILEGYQYGEDVMRAMGAPADGAPVALGGNGTMRWLASAGLILLGLVAIAIAIAVIRSF